MQRAFKLPYLASIFLLVYTPFHIFLSQWLSTYTGQLDFWKIAKDLLLFAAILLTIGLVYIKSGFKDRIFWILVLISGIYFGLHLLIWQLNPETTNKPALLATAYNCRLLGYAILGWGTALTAKKYFTLKQIFRVLIVVSTIICLLGIIQYFLPKDFLTHFGYSFERGARPAFFIDNKPDLPRIMSTLRDPNSLGAYLILPIAILLGAWLKKPKQRMFFSGLLLLHGLALFLTFSRSAWLGAILAGGIIFAWHFKEQAKAIVKKYWYWLLAGLAVLLIGGFLLRDQYVVQNVIFHSDENTKELDSNNKHAQYASRGLKGIAHEPLGHGPGTAGLVSIQTDDVVLTENYFIQIGYEVGVFGLALLLAVMAFVCRLLYRTNDFYSRALLASFVGLSLCCMLLHTWSNEAVAAQWWLLTSLVLASSKKPAIR